MLILGEKHNFENLCTESKSYEIHKWLYDLIRENDQIIDLYLEYPKMHNISNEILELDKYYSKILAIDHRMNLIKENLNHNKKLKYHQIDVRQFYNKNYLKDNKNNPFIQSDFIILIKELHLLNEIDDRDLIIKLLSYSTGYKIDQEYELFYINFMIKTFKNFDLNNHKIYRKLYIKIIENYISQIEIFNRDIFFITLIDLYLNYINFDKLYASFLSCEMDVLFLLKYLKGKSKNSIVYVGNIHAELYSNFIISWYKIKPKIEITSNKYGNNLACIYFPVNFNFFGENKSYKIENLKYDYFMNYIFYNFNYNSLFIEKTGNNMYILYYDKIHLSTLSFKKNELNIVSLYRVNELNTNIFFNNIINVSNNLSLNQIQLFDDSKLYFKNDQNDEICKIKLYYINLLAYGKTWYERIGFEVKKDGNWNCFINRNFYKFLSDIEFEDIDNLSNNYYTISETFISIIKELKEYTIYREGIYNIVNWKNFNRIINIKKLLYYIFSFNDEDDEDEEGYKFVPQFDTEHFLYL